MKLPIPFKKENQEKNEYYLALILTDERVNAVILEEYQKKLKIIGSHAEYFASSLETLSLDDIIAVADKSISRAEEVLPPSIETHKTVFCVKESWIEDETKKIKKEYLGKLKKLCNVLDLSPLGFMVLTEAFSNYLQKHEGAPLSAILAEIGHKLIIVTLFRGGKVVEKFKGPKDQSAPISVDKLLTHFTVPVLPARIVIFCPADLDNLSQQFIHHHWSKNLPFLHMPQITVLPQSFDALAVTYGAAMQMGFETSEELSLNNPNLPHQTESTEQDTADDSQIYSDSLILPQTNESHESDFGFRLNEDVGLIPVTNDEQPDNTNESDPDMESESKLEETENLEQQADTINDEDETDTTPTKKKRFLFSLPSNFIPKIPTFTFPKRGGLILLILFIIILILAGLGVSYIYLYKTHAAITLLVTPKMAGQPKNGVTFSAGAQNNYGNNIIAAQAITANVNGNASTNTTGQKEIGNKAVGTVTIYNSSDSDQTLNSGTTLTSSNNLSFVTTNSITIASASGDIFSGTKPGTTDVNIAASDFGTDYNLPSGTTFTVDGNSNLAGKNNDAFSGGSKSSVVVVSRTDIANLGTKLTQSLQNQGLSALTQKVSGSQSVLPTVIGESISNPTYDNNIGDQASTVTLTATVVFSGLSYNKNDLDNYAQFLLKNHNSQKINFASNSLKVDISNTKVIDNTDMSATITISAGILPNINTTNIIQQIQNKSYNQAKTVLMSLPQVTNSTFAFSPNIPILPYIFPRLPKNITIIIRSNE